MEAFRSRIKALLPALLLCAGLITAGMGVCAAASAPPASAPASSPAAAAGKAAEPDFEAVIAAGPTLPVLISAAYARNPSITAARKAWDAALRSIPAAEAWDDPELTAAYWPDSLADAGSRKWQLMVTQALPLPGRTTAAGRVARALALSGRIALDAAVRQTVTAVTASFHELSYIRRALELAAGNREALRSLSALADSSYARDRATLTDAMKARSQAAQAELDLAYFKEQEAVETARMNELLDRPATAPIGPLAPLAGPPWPTA